MSIEKMTQTSGGLIGFLVIVVGLALGGGAGGGKMLGGVSSEQIGQQIDEALSDRDEKAKLERENDRLRLDAALAEIKQLIAASNADVTNRVMAVSMKTQDRVYRYELIDLQLRVETWVRGIARSLGYEGDIDMPRLPLRPDHAP